MNEINKKDENGGKFPAPPFTFSMNSITKNKRVI